MAELSIIVPVYNNKNYLMQCIDSIINPKLRDIEIILVDDGSTDGSGAICDKYCDLDERIQLIHQENRGCLYARLQGLKESSGEYVGFVDSDDWIASDMYELLMYVAKTKNCDIVSMGYTTVFGTGEKGRNDGTLFGLYEKGINLNILLYSMMYDLEKQERGVQPSLCSKVFKRKLLEDAYASVDQSITLGEDAAIFYPCCLNANKVFIMEEYKYYYRVHNKSMCRNVNINVFDQVYVFYNYMMKTIGEYEEQYSLVKQLKMYIWTFISPGLKQIFDIQVGSVYLFPYVMVEKNSNIILYGAGEVGQAFHLQILDNCYCNIVAWVDKNKCDKRNIIHTKQIINLEYSKIVIAVKERKVADEIIEELNMLGINIKNIVWDKPRKITSVVF